MGGIAKPKRKAYQAPGLCALCSLLLSLCQLLLPLPLQDTGQKAGGEAGDQLVVTQHGGA